MKNYSAMWLRTIILLGLTGLIPIGCKRKSINVEAQKVEEFEMAVPELTRLNNIYFNGSAAEARVSLLTEANLLIAMTSNQLAGIALRVVYGRLHTIEIIEGDTNAANIFLDKANHIDKELWNARHASSSHVVNSSVGKATSEQVMRWVFESDAGMMGRQPNYRINTSLSNDDTNQHEQHSVGSR